MEGQDEREGGGGGRGGDGLDEQRVGVGEGGADWGTPILSYPILD